MHLSSEQKRILRWVGYPLVALLSFVFAFFYTFPYGRLKGKIVEVLSEKYDVSIASIEPTLLPGGMVLDTVMLKTRPESPDEKPVVIVFQEIELDFGIFAAMRGRLDLDLMASVAGGTIEGSVELGSSGFEADLATEMLPLANLPGVTEAVGLPMFGGLNAKIRLDVPIEQDDGRSTWKWTEADGRVELTCVGCTVGDGVAKLKMKPQGRRRSRRAEIFASEGLTVPRLQLGAAAAVVDIEDGVGEIESFTATSNDGFLQIEGEIEFAEPFTSSTFPGCMTFKLSDELKERESTFGGIEAMLPPRARQSDGSYSIPTKGKLTALRWDVRRQCKGASGASSADDGPRARPSIPSRPPSERTTAGDLADGEDERLAPPPPEDEPEEEPEDEPAEEPEAPMMRTGPDDVGAPIEPPDEREDQDGAEQDDDDVRGDRDLEDEGELPPDEEFEDGELEDEVLDDEVLE